MNKQIDEKLMIDIEKSVNFNDKKLNREKMIKALRKTAKRLNVSYQKFFNCKNNKIILE